MTVSRKIRRHVALRLNEEYYDKLLQRRILLLTGDISGNCDCGEEEKNMINKFSHSLLHLAAEQPSKKPILIILNSSGDDVYMGFAIHDIITMLVKQSIDINILANGMVASLALVILQAGTKRLASSNSQFLMHQVKESILFGTEETSEAEERTRELRRINNAMLGIIAERAGMGLEELFELSTKTDVWFSAQDALKFGTKGLVDEVAVSFPL